MKFLLAILVVFISYQSQASERTPVAQACLDKVVAAVNKHHTLAEGSVYALRVVYNGDSAFVALVGHSDETEPTDYLVTVKKHKCKMESIVYTNEAGDVEEYTDDEQI
jgi:hypothetical protein